MEISKGIHIIDLSLFIEESKTLVFGDFHMGFEDALRKEGVLVPHFQFEDTVKRLENIFKKIKENNWKINKIILNGDIKHEFGRISDQEWREALKLFDFLAKQCNKVILVKGNHDVILEPIAKKRNIPMIDEHKANEVLILHGHKEPEQNIKEINTIIIGNEHPCITLREGMRKEKFKCFLKGKWKRKTLIVMPSFNNLTVGTDIREGHVLSPYLEQDLSNFEAFAIEDAEVYQFGKLKSIE